MCSHLPLTVGIDCKLGFGGQGTHLFSLGFLCSHPYPLNPSQNFVPRNSRCPLKKNKQTNKLSFSLACLPSPTSKHSNISPLALPPCCSVQVLVGPEQALQTQGSANTHRPHLLELVSSWTSMPFGDQIIPFHELIPGKGNQFGRPTVPWGYKVICG